MPASRGMGRWLLALLMGASLLAGLVVWRDLDRLDAELASESLLRLDAVEEAWSFRRSLLEGQRLADRAAAGQRPVGDLLDWLRATQARARSLAEVSCASSSSRPSSEAAGDEAVRREIERLARETAERFDGLAGAIESAAGGSGALDGQALDGAFEAVRRPLRRLFAEQINRQSELLARGRDYAIQARTTFAQVALVAMLLGLLLYTVYRRRRAAERRATETFRLAASALEGAIFNWDVASGVVSWSEGVRGVFAFPDASLSVSPAWCYERIVPEDRKKFRRDVEGAALSTGQIELECRVVAGDGTIRVVAARARAERGRDGQALRVAGSVIDVTRRRRAEEELRERERFIRRVAETVPYLLYVYDLEKKEMVYVNRSFPALLGFGERAGAVDRQYLAERAHPDDRAGLVASRFRWAELADDEIEEQECRFSDASGEWRWFQGRNAVFARGADGKPTRIVGTAQDVTERKNAEAALRRAQERLELALWGGDLGLWDWNIATGSIAYNERSASMLGYKPSEIPSRVEARKAMVHPDDYEGAREEMRKHLAGETGIYQREYRMRAKSGEWRWILDRGKVVERDAEGKPLRAAGIHLDATERKKAEQALRESEARLQTAIESLPFDFWISDSDGRYAMQNSHSISRWGDLKGRRPDEAAGLPESIAAEWSGNNRRALGGEVVRMEASYPDVDGSPRHYEKIVAPVRVGGRVVGSLGVNVDITQRKIAEEELRRRETLLQAAASCSERLLRSPDWRAEVDGILAQVGRAARASRVYFFDVEPSPEGDEFHCSQRFEWAAPGVRPEIDNPDLQRMALRASGFGRWAEKLALGETLHGLVSEFPEGERAVLEPQGIVSMMVAPVFSGGAWRGFVGYDDCAGERAWSPAEAGILKAVAETLGSAMSREMADRALRESEERYRQLVDAAPVGILVHVDKQFVFANREAARILGAESPDRVVGLNVFDIVPPEFRGFVERRVRSLLEGAPVMPLAELRLARLDGGLADVEIIGIPMRYQGRPAVQALVHDIAGRKRGEAARQLMLRVAQAASETDNLPQLLRSIHRSLADAIFISELHVALLDPSTGRLDFSRVDAGTPPDRPTPSPDQAPPSPPASRRLAALALEEERPLLMAADGGDARPYAPGQAPAPPAGGAALWMAVPLATGERAIGAVALLGREERDIELVEFVSGQIARAVERQAARESLRAVAQGTAGVTGDDFFFSLVEHLARALRVRYAVVSELDSTGSRRARALAFWANGALEPNFEYDLAGTPREVALARSSCCYAAGVADAFPDDAFLRERRVESYVCSALRNSVGQTVGFLDVLHDQPLRDTAYAESILRIFAARAAAEIERQRAEERVAHQALHDPLTGLPNRALFIDRARGAAARCERRGESMGVLFIDLDRFKWVNDSHGHAAGDELIAQAAGRLLASARNEDTVARLGGDEFTILLERIESPMDATKVADRVLESLRRPFMALGREIRLSASVGIALAMSGDEARSGDLLRDADSAMYRAKAKGKNRYEIFDAALDERLRDKMRLETDLRRAVERGEIEVAYQPRVNLSTGRIEGAEALARWRHPERGLLQPESFIPLAEETGVVLEIDRRVLEMACARMRAWRAIDPELALSANLSARQFPHNEALVEQVRAALEESGLDHGALRLEITESAAMDDAEATARALRRIRSLGVGIEIDDFGVGYSSLRYLRRFPVDALKIDRSFVVGLEGDGSENAAIVRAIVALARNLGLRLIAEGIETPAQLAYLRELGCEHGQGFLFAKPLPVEEMEALIRSQPRW